METTNKYMNTKIYKIVDNAYTECYIGSTIQGLSTRMALHRRDYKQYKVGNASYVSSYALFEKYGVDNCKIELLEDYPCESKDQLNKREGHHIKLEECINKYVAGRTLKEWREDHKEYKQEHDKQYRETNKEKKQTTDKAYYEANKEKRHATAKAYYEANKETQNEKTKQYSSEKVVCPVCQHTLSRGSMRRHKRLCKD